jgi:hypothetical protein
VAGEAQLQVGDNAQDEIDYAWRELRHNLNVLFCPDVNAGLCNRDGMFMNGSASDRIYFDTDALPARIPPLLRRHAIGHPPCCARLTPRCWVTRTYN